MRSADAARQVPWLRYALIATALSVMWLAISLFSSTTSASADEGDSGSGLLGTVGSLLGGVTSVTGAVGDTVGDVVDTVVAPVNQVAEPVVEVAPEPVAAVVPNVTDTVTDAANTVVSGANTAVGTVVNGVTGTVSGIAGGGTVGAVATPIAGLVDGVVGSLPIVGDLVGSDTVGGVLGPVAGLVDTTLGTVVGSLGELPTDGTGIIPQLPGIPLIPGDSTPGESGGPGDVVLPVDPGAVSPDAAPGLLLGADLTRSHSATAGEVLALLGTIAPAGGGAPPGDGAPALGVPAGGTAGSASGASGSGGAGASGASEAAFAALELDALASLVLNSVDDELPSSPVYDTDSTPD